MSANHFIETVNSRVSAMAASVVRSRFVFISLLAHLSLLLLVGTWAVTQASRRCPQPFALHWDGGRVRELTITVPPDGFPTAPPARRAEAWKPPEIRLDPVIRIPHSTFSQAVARSAPVNFDIAPSPPPPAVDWTERPGLAGQGRSGSNGTGRGASGDGTGPGGHEVSFFGIRARAEKIVILVDASTSMLFPNKGGFEGYRRVKQEVVRLIQELPDTSAFNVILFSDSAYVFSSQGLVSVTDDSKRQATQWIQPLHDLDERMATAVTTSDAWTGPLLVDFEKKRYTPSDPDLPATGGTRVDIALLATFEQKPDSIFIISDGEPQIGGWSSSRVLQKVSQWRRDFYQKAFLPLPCVHVVSYEADSRGVAFLRNLAGQNQGKFLHIKGFRDQKTAHLTGY